MSQKVVSYSNIQTFKHAYIVLGLCIYFQHFIIIFYICQPVTKWKGSHEEYDDCWTTEECRNRSSEQWVRGVECHGSYVTSVGQIFPISEYRCVFKVRTQAFTHIPVWDYKSPLHVYISWKEDPLPEPDETLGWEPDGVAVVEVVLVGVQEDVGMYHHRVGRPLQVRDHCSVQM